MTALLKEWLLGMTAVAMLLALADYLVPEGGAKGVCRLAGGLVLMLAAVGPVLRLEQADFSSLLGCWEEDAAAVAAEDGAALYESIIAQQCSAYILDKAEDLGISCRVEVSCERGEEGVPVPVGAKVEGVWTQAQREALCQAIAEDLGIPEWAQQFERIQP